MFKHEVQGLALKIECMLTANISIKILINLLINLAWSKEMVWYKSGLFTYSASLVCLLLWFGVADRSKKESFNCTLITILFRVSSACSKVTRLTPQCFEIASIVKEVGRKEKAYTLQCYTFALVASCGAGTTSCCPQFSIHVRNSGVNFWFNDSPAGSWKG